jgi:hypothetical protein
MKAVVGLFAVVAALAAAPATIAGTWNMALHGGHDIPTALVLKQQDAKVTGTIRLPTQHIGQLVEVDLAGEFVDRALTLSGDVEHADPPTTVKITGTMKDDGTLEGTISMGDHQVPWTAERLKERKPSGF